MRGILQENVIHRLLLWQSHQLYTQTSPLSRWDTCTLNMHTGKHYLGESSALWNELFYRVDVFMFNGAHPLKEHENVAGIAIYQNRNLKITKS